MLYATWEDRADEMARRLSQISGDAASWCTPGMLDNLRMLDLAGHGPLWNAPGRYNVPTWTRLGQALRQVAESEAIGLLILDSLAAVYGANENDRGQVRDFMASWDAWAAACNCTVLIIGHPPKSSAGYSGSTDWHSAARARWEMGKDHLRSPSRGSRQDPTDWKLAMVKSNYGPEPPSLCLEWDSTGPRWAVRGTWDTAIAERNRKKLPHPPTARGYIVAISESGPGQSLSGEDVLESLADSHQKDPVTLADLADWLVSGECPQDTLRAAAASVWQLIMILTDTASQVADELMPQLEGAAQDTEHSESRRLEIANILTDYFNREVLFSTRAPGIAMDMFLDASRDSVVVTHIGHHFPLLKDGPLSNALSQLSAQSSIEIPIIELVTLWNETPETERPKGGFPLDILYLAWLNRPQPVEPSTREKGRIIPAKIAQVAPGDRRAGKLFTTAAHVSPDIEAGQLSFAGFQQLGTSAGNATERQSIMPGFQDPETIGPCLPLALYDLGDAPATSRGPAAPLALRLFVESVLAVPMDSRDVDSPVAMRVTLRQMLDWIYPGEKEAATKRILAQADGSLRRSGIPGGQSTPV